MLIIPLLRFCEIKEQDFIDINNVYILTLNEWCIENSSEVESKNYRMVEQETSGDHRVQTPCSGRVT